MRRRTWKRGDAVVVELPDGTRVDAQVWSLAPEDGAAWLALSTGRFGKVTRKGEVVAERGRLIGKVAA